MRYFIISTVFIISLSACFGTKNTTTNKKTTKTAQQWSNEGYFAAIVSDFSSLDGCGFLLITEKDKKELMPVQLADSMQKDKLAVWIKYHTLKNTQNTCMKGVPVQIDEVYLR